MVESKFYQRFDKYNLTVCYVSQMIKKIGRYQGLSWEFVTAGADHSKFKGVTHPYVVKLPKSTGARHYCLTVRRVPDTLGTRANSSPGY